MEIPSAANVNFDKWTVKFRYYEDWTDPSPLPWFQFNGLSFSGSFADLNQNNISPNEMLDVIAVGVKAIIDELVVRSGRPDIWLANDSVSITYEGVGTGGQYLDLTPEEPEQEVTEPTP